MLKAVIFDMDGVMIDSEPLHARAAILALKQYNIDISIEYCSQFIGSTTLYMCQRMVSEFSLPITPEELLKANIDWKETLRSTEGYPAVPYVIDTIKDLSSHGLKLFIASSSPAADIEYVMSSLHISNYFVGYVSGMQFERPKPAPDIFLAAAKLLGITPEECIVIEDSTNGVNAAYAAGMTCIGFVNPNSGKQDLGKASYLIEGFDEIDYDFIRKVYHQEHWTPSDIVSTKRLILRELSVSDAEALYHIMKDLNLTALSDDRSASPEEEAERRKAYIRNIYGFYGYGQWGVFLRDTGKLIGCCGIELKEMNGIAEYELSYLIAKEYRRLGYAYEAADAVIKYFIKNYQPDTIITVIDKQNIPSKHLALKLGMSESDALIRNHRECNRYLLSCNALK